MNIYIMVEGKITERMQKKVKDTFREDLYLRHTI